MSNKAGYDRLVAQAREDPASVDYAQLLASRPKVPSSVADREAMTSAARRDDWPTAARFAEHIVARDFTDIGAHALLSRFQERSGNAERARFHERVVRGLMKASPPKADRQSYLGYLEGLPVGEGYTIMSQHGLQLCRQALSEQMGHYFDVHMVREPLPEDEED